MRHYNYRRNARVAAVDEHAATELALFVDNDGDLYRVQTSSIIENLAKKHAKGQFDASKAAKLFGYLADNGAKKYAWEFGDRKPGTRSWHAQGADGNGLFNAPTRREAARRLLASNMEAIEDRARELGGASRRNPRASKHVYMYVLQGNYGYGHGWEDLAAEDKAVTGAGKRIRQTLKEYRENEGGNYRIIERREAK